MGPRSPDAGGVEETEIAVALEDKIAILVQRASATVAKDSADVLAGYVSLYVRDHLPRRMLESLSDEALGRFLSQRFAFLAAGAPAGLVVQVASPPAQEAPWALDVSTVERPGSPAGHPVGVLGASRSGN
jgi:hypothetical protein